MSARKIKTRFAKNFLKGVPVCQAKGSLGTYPGLGVSLQCGCVVVSDIFAGVHTASLVSFMSKLFLCHNSASDNHKKHFRVLPLKTPLCDASFDTCFEQPTDLHDQS